MTCEHCHATLDDVGAFCASCGSRRAEQPSGPIFERRATADSGLAQKTIKELKLIGLRNILPYKECLADKPWNLIWVRWFIGVALFPLLLVFWASTSALKFESVAFLFGMYFAVMWAVFLYFILRPKLRASRIAQVWLFTVMLGIAIVLTLQQFPIVSSLYAASESASITGRLIGFVFGVGILEELTKILPLWWLYIHKRNDDDLSTIVFLGCISGFAFGVAEAARYSISYMFGLMLGGLGSGEYLMVQMTRFITLPLLHGIWTGIAAYFIALGSVNRHVTKGLVVAGILVAAILHGLYDAFSDSILGVVTAVVSIIIFVSYYRSGQMLQARIISLQPQHAARPRPKDGAGSGV